MRNRCLMGTSLALLIVVSCADASAADLAAADALFNKGVAELKAGNFAAACPAFAESQQLDPRPGTMYAMAECEAKAGRIATAVALYDDFLRTVGSLKSMPQRLKYLERTKNAQAQRDKLVKDVPQLTLILPAGSPQDLRMTRNGEVFTAATLGLAIPVDPGEQVITVQLSTGVVNEQRITLDVGEQKTLEIQVPALEVKAAEPGPQPPAPPPPARPLSLRPTAVASPPVAKPASGLRTGGFVALGVGVAGLVGFGVTGGLAMAKKSFFEETCPKNVCANAADAVAARAAFGQAQTLATLTTVGLGVSGAAVLAGLVMAIVGKPRGENDRVALRVHAAVIEAGPAGVVFGVKGVF